MSVSGVQGQLLEVTVVECTKLKDTEWIKGQEPYVCVEYGSTKFRTRTSTDGDKNPVFQEKFLFTLIEGLKEINVVVWNSNPISYDHLIGSGKVQLQDVLSGGYSNRSWPLLTKTGRYAGEVKLIIHYDRTRKPTPTYTPYTPRYATIPTPQHQLNPYSTLPTTSTSSYTTPPAYSFAATTNRSIAATYQPLGSAYETPIHYSTHPFYPPPQMGYSYPLPPPNPSIYPPPPYPAPAGYPVPPYGPPGGFHGRYTQPPYSETTAIGERHSSSSYTDISLYFHPLTSMSLNLPFLCSPWT